MYSVDVKGGLSRYQYVCVGMGEDEIFQRVDIDYRTSPSKVVIKIPEMCDLVKITGQDAEAIPVAVNSDGEWRTTVDELKKSRLYCVTNNLVGYINAKCENILAYPCDVDIKVDDSRVIPAKTTLLVRYEPSITTFGTAFTKAHASLATMTFSNLHDEIRGLVDVFCRDVTALWRGAKSVTELAEAIDGSEIARNAEIKANGSLRSKGLQVKFTFSNTSPFNRMNSTAWSDYVDGVEKRNEQATILSDMKGDVEFLETYVDNYKTIKELKNELNGSDNSQKKLGGKSDK